LISFLGLELAHPIVNGSGTYDAIAARRAFGDALLERFPFSAFVSKTITLEPRAGNPPPRLFETPAGLINSIGLPNKGLRGYLEHDLPELAARGSAARPAGCPVRPSARSRSGRSARSPRGSRARSSAWVGCSRGGTPRSCSRRGPRWLPSGPKASATRRPASASGASFTICSQRAGTSWPTLNRCTGCPGKKRCKFRQNRQAVRTSLKLR
jgi:hypothetical protein